MKFSLTIHRIKGNVDYVNYDIWGPSPIITKGGAQYLLIFIDKYSKKARLYFLKIKIDVFVTFKQLKPLIEKYIDKNIKCLRTDNCLEFYACK